MATLQKAVYAMHIHPKTGQDIAEEKLPAGTKYKFVSRKQEAFGWWLTIEVEGYWYDVQCPYSHIETDTCTHTSAEYQKKEKE